MGVSVLNLPGGMRELFPKSSLLLLGKWGRIKANRYSAVTEEAGDSMSKFDGEIFKTLKGKKWGD